MMAHCATLSNEVTPSDIVSSSGSLLHPSNDAVDDWIVGFPKRNAFFFGHVPQMYPSRFCATLLGAHDRINFGDLAKRCVGVESKRHEK